MAIDNIIKELFVNITKDQDFTRESYITKEPINTFVSLF